MFERIVSILVKIFYSVLLLCFVITYAFGQVSQNKIDFWIILFMLVFVFLFGIISKVLIQLSNNAFEKIHSKFKWIMLAILLVQILVGLALKTENTWGWDYDTVVLLAKRYVGGIEFDYSYLAQYPNNILYFLFVSGIFYISNFFLGTYSTTLLIIVNILVLDICVWGIYKIVFLIKGERAAVFVFITCMLFLPFWFYIPIAYTDFLSMPFFVFSILFIIMYEKNNKNKYYLFMIGVLGALGYYFKGTPIIAFVAILIYCFFSNNSKKDKFNSIAIMVSFFTVSFLLLSLFISKFSLVSEEQKDRHEYPVIHWINMGLNGDGTWNSEIVTEINECRTYEEKVEYSKDKIETVINEKGFVGVIYHILKKEACVMWDDGLLNSDMYVVRNPEHERFVYNVFDKESLIFKLISYYSSGFWDSVLVIYMLGIGIHVIQKSKVDYTFLLYLTNFGVFLFYAIWEVNSRYLVNNVFSVLICFSATFYDIMSKNVLICKKV